MTNMDYAQIKRIADQVRAVDPDDDLVADMIEGETDALEVADGLLERLTVIDSHIEALKIHETTIKERKARFNRGKDACRSGLLKLLEVAGLKKIERPLATFSRKRSVPALIEGSIDALPPELTRTKIEPDKTAIRQALERGQHIPGWALGNGGETISVRSK